jgi:hypothetical protein
MGDGQSLSLGSTYRLVGLAPECQWVEPTEGAEGESRGVLFYRNISWQLIILDACLDGLRGVSVVLLGFMKNKWL